MVLQEPTDVIPWEQKPSFLDRPSDKQSCSTAWQIQTGKRQQDFDLRLVFKTPSISLSAVREAFICRNVFSFQTLISDNPSVCSKLFNFFSKKNIKEQVWVQLLCLDVRVFVTCSQKLCIYRVAITITETNHNRTNRGAVEAHLCVFQAKRSTIKLITRKLYSG